MPEKGPAIDRPVIYRGLLFAFGVWGAHFIVAYGAALIFPGLALARWIALAATVMAVAVLLLAAHRYGRRAGRLGLLTLALALAAVFFGTLPAVIG